MKLKKRNRVILTVSAIAALIIFPIAAYEWPQTNVTSDNFYSFFGQKRSNTLSNSLIFSESETAASTDKGEISVIITEHDDGFNWFESTLGTAVIVNHEDSLVTVYGNLDTDELNTSLYDNPSVSTGTQFATTGNSGWQETDSYLEFQIIDTKNNNYVNPLILMPRLVQKDSLTLTGILLKNKFGKVYDLESQRNIPSGVYKIYKSRQPKAVPYKTTLLVNGTESERISFNTIKQKNSELAVEGHNLYSAEELYPDNDIMLLGELYLPRGKDTISVIVTDFSGKEYSRVFTLTVL